MKKIFLQFILAGIILGSGKDSKPRQEITLPDQHISVPADMLKKLKKAERELDQLKRERESVINQLNQLQLNQLPSAPKNNERPSV